MYNASFSTRQDWKNFSFLGVVYCTHNKGHSFMLLFCLKLRSNEQICQRRVWCLGYTLYNSFRANNNTPVGTSTASFIMETFFLWTVAHIFNTTATNKTLLYPQQPLNFISFSIWKNSLTFFVSKALLFIHSQYTKVTTSKLVLPFD